jgi:AsmA family protein
MRKTNNKYWRWTRRIILGAVALFFITIAGVIFYVSIFNITGWAEKKLGTTAGRTVDIAGDITIDWGWPITRIRITDISVGNMEGGSDPTMFSAKSVDAGVNVRKLLTFNFAFSELLLDKPNLLLEKNKDGDANWNFTDNPEGEIVDNIAPDDRSDIPEIERLVIKDGRLRYKDPTENIDINSSINTVVGSASGDQQVTMTGKGLYQNRPFTLNFKGGSALLLQESSTPYPIDFRSEIADTLIEMHGTVTDPVAMEGININLRLKGNNAADIFPIFGIVLPPTPPYDITGTILPDS